MKRGCVSFLSFFATAMLSCANAAEISHEATPAGDVISLSGPINRADVASFEKLADRYANATVVLNSEGGLLMPALEIGKIIRARGYTTAVAAKNTCASSCALIWLAGKTRALHRDGRVGFHASYLDRVGRPEESGVANALIGGFLSRLGYPERTIVFATTAPPRQIVWLSDANKGLAGIQYEVWADGTATVSRSNGVDSIAEDTRPRDVKDTSRGDVNNLPKHLPLSLSTGGSRWINYGSDSMFFDANSIQFVKDSYGNAVGRRFWFLGIYPEKLPEGYEKGLSYSLVQYFVYCPDQSVAINTWIDHFSDGKVKRQPKLETGGKSNPAEPGSIRQVLVNYVCAFDQ